MLDEGFGRILYVALVNGTNGFHKTTYMEKEVLGRYKNELFKIWELLLLSRFLTLNNLDLLEVLLWNVRHLEGCAIVVF